MAHMRWKTFLAPLLIAPMVAVMMVSTAAAANTAPRMPMDELKAMLGSPNLLLIDVRQPGDWDADDLKIKGAVRMAPADFETWKNTLPRDKTIVLYCA